MKPYQSLSQIRSDLNARKTCAVELTQLYLDRIQKYNDQLNCFISVHPEQALAAARNADQRIRQGISKPLLGIPIAHKDLFCTKGLPTTCGSKMLQNFVSPYDSTVVSNIRNAGAITLGKTNMDEFAMGSSNETSYFGVVANPWDTSRSPGGSSGGSASAVAAGLVPLATGSDTGGSIRQPCGFCGTTGLKPTYGRVSRFGMIAFASSLDQGGPIANSAADCATLLQAMEGYDPRDSTSANVAATNCGDLDRKLKIGLPTHLFKDLDGEIAQNLDTAKAELTYCGHEFVEIELPHSDVASATYYVISGAEASANLSRYDGVRYGHRAESPVDLNDLYRRSRSEGFGAEVKRRILTGTFALSVGYFDAYYLKAQKVRRLIRQDFLDAFESVDLIFTPVTPTTAFELGSLTDNPVEMYQQDLYTIPASLAGLPALSLPCGFKDGLPVNFQLIGRHFDEATILSAAQQYQGRTSWHESHPTIFESSDS